MKYVVGEVGTIDSCSGIDNFLEALGWVYHLVIFFLNDFNLFAIGISSQDVCHILEVCIFIHLFTPWYGRVVMVEYEVEVIALSASISTFDFQGCPFVRELLILWTHIISALKQNRPTSLFNLNMLHGFYLFINIRLLVRSTDVPVLFTTLHYYDVRI